MKYTEIEEVRVEKERLIHGRYLLQRPLAQGQVCAVYKGFDQVLQRAVVVKAVPVPHIASYRDAVKLTAEFSHPNIIGIYDMIEDADTLFLMQEYVEGEPFRTMLQTQLSPYQVADIGVQICHALFYASVREVCHGDLTPAALLRDKRGLIRINNFALTSDLSYFTAWSVIGGNGIILSDNELPWGKVSDGRRDDDVRAVGLLLYQLLAGRAPGATNVEPPADGRLHFLRGVPVELCELIARAVVRQHPQHITTIEPLQDALLKLIDAQEPPEGASNHYSSDDMGPLNQAAAPVTPSAPIAPPASIAAERLVTALPMREGNQGSLSAYRNDSPGVPAHLQQATVANTPDASGADPSVRFVSAQDVNFIPSTQPVAGNTPVQQELPSRRLSLPILMALGVIIFILFFVVGYFVAHAIFP